MNMKRYFIASATLIAVSILQFSIEAQTTSPTGWQFDSETTDDSGYITTKKEKHTSGETRELKTVHFTNVHPMVVQSQDEVTMYSDGKTRKSSTNKTFNMSGRQIRHQQAEYDPKKHLEVIRGKEWFYETEANGRILEPRIYLEFDPKTKKWVKMDIKDQRWNASPLSLALAATPGARFSFGCPEYKGAANGLTFDGDGIVIGTKVYKDASAICPSAVHAGLIPLVGGSVTIEIKPALQSYEESTVFGVRSLAANTPPAKYSYSFIP